jgi:hypothetical protein
VNAKEAKAEAVRRWGVDARIGWISRCRTSPKFRVGFMGRAGRDMRALGGVGMVVVGSSDEGWDAAFVAANVNPAGVVECDDSPTAKHEYSPNLEHAQKKGLSGEDVPESCEWCGEEKPVVESKRADEAFPKRIVWAGAVRQGREEIGSIAGVNESAISRLVAGVRGKNRAEAVAKLLQLAEDLACAIRRDASDDFSAALEGQKSPLACAAEPRPPKPDPVAERHAKRMARIGGRS